MKVYQKRNLYCNLSKGELTNTYKWPLILAGLLAITVATSAFSGYKIRIYDTKINNKLKEYKVIQNNKTEQQIQDYVKQLNNKQNEIEDLKKRVEAKKSTQVAKVQVIPTAQATGSSDAKTFIYMKESGNRPDAINKSSGACGLGQALPCSKMPCTLTDYACQDAFFTKYMQNRYGTWENAKSFWLAHRWW